MEEIVIISGPPGAGKTMATQNLNPKEVYYVNTDKKSLPYPNPGYSKDDEKSKTLKGNMLYSSDPLLIEKRIKLINKSYPQCNKIIIDTASSIMNDDEMRRMKEPGFDKWKDLAVSIWKFLTVLPSELREDLIIYMFFHEENVFDDDGVRTIQVKTNGRKTRKLEPESRVNIVLRAHYSEDDDNMISYFQTKREENDHAKSNLDLFPHKYMPKDLEIVDQCIRLYHNLGGVKKDFKIENIVEPEID